MKIQTIFIIGIIILSYFLFGCKMSSNAKSEIYCETTSDCACGKHIIKKDCFLGNKNFVDAGEICPDFCAGIYGNMDILCIDNECVQKLSKCKTYQVEECPFDCSICPACEMCGDLTCQSKDFCKSIGYEKSMHRILN